MTSASPSSAKADILVVDDQPDNIRLLSTLLLEQGYKVRKATHGEMALTAIDSCPPDLVLLDINMPVMNGYDVCAAVKANPKTSHIPIIFLSALDESLDKVRAFQVGGADYVSKPFQVEEVLARLENHLTIQRQRQQLSEQNQRLQQEVETRQQTEEILYQSRALLASVLNSSLDGVGAAQAVRDRTGRVADFRCLVVNPVAARLVGRRREELTGKLLLRSLIEQIDPTLFAELVEVVETGQLLERELYHCYEGHETWFQIVSVKLGDGMAVTFRDITRQKQSELALQLANQELQRLAHLDGLTQLANRRRFDEYLEQEWRRLRRDRQYLSLIVCDVDYFKAYNDRYGHQAGDDCLKRVAEALVNMVQRPADLVARYGGEELAVILPNTNETGASHVASQIASAIASLHIPHAASTISAHLTVSMGVASVIPDESRSPADLFAAADQALYAAKQQGRNRYCMADIQADLGKGAPRER
jgi:two-component system cell cycle response regulator